MPIYAKASGGNFIPAPAGTHSGVCVDVEDLGLLKVNFGGKEKLSHKVQLVWQIAEDRPDGKPFTVRKRYTLSLHEKASLRKDLESWRGRKFSEEELGGFDLENLLSIPCMVNVIQEQKDGQTYSNVTGVMRLPKGMAVLTVRDYVRKCDRPPTTAEAVPPPPDDDVPPPPENEWDKYHGTTDEDSVPF